jgi:transcription-repair coupling factor (superfamily II helicase)
MTSRDSTLTDTGASTLLEKVRRTSVFGSFRIAIERAQGAAERGDSNGAGVNVTGLRGSSSVFLMEAMRERAGQPIVVVCPDQETAEDVFSDLGTISPARTLLFPERDILPQRHEVGENLAIRGDRNEVLLRILAGKADVVVTSLLGFLEKTIPVDRLTASRTTISRGDTVDLEDLREALVNVGYYAVSLVEEAGQFAVRGSIVDIFDPSWQHPARIELYDDEVDSIRSFDLDSQRSIEHIESVSVLPAASVPFDEDATSGLANYLRGAGFQKEVIERIQEEVTHSRHSYLWRRYAPALGVNGSLMDFFEEKPLLWFFQMEGLNRAWQRLAEDMEYAMQRPAEDYPLLALADYLHPPLYFEGHGAPSVRVWDLTAAAVSRRKSATAAPETDTDTDTDAPAPEAQTPPAAFEPIHEGETVVRFRTTEHPNVVGKLDPFFDTIQKLHENRCSIHIYSETPTQRERLADMLEEKEHLVHLPVGWIRSGFVWDEAAVAVFTDHQIFNRILPRPRRTLKKRRVQGFRHEHLQLGDFVVHVHYGIGRFTGLEKVGGNGDANGQETECLVLRYHGGDKIYVPLDQMHLVEKYVGKEGVVPRIDKLGSNRWVKTREKAKKAIEDVARELLEIYATREVAPGYAFSSDTQWQRDLEAAFPHEETPHQLRATEEIKGDMEKDRPMDRLVCGDVGYGKTEVAIRAAFKAVAEGKQVAVLVPTTLLAFQHFNTFRERIVNYPLEIRMLSRFVTKSEQTRTVEGLKNGTIDVVIGTHRLLSKDIEFKDLGILIIDEEHRFGVKHKERLKRLMKAVDVLSLTATPIPRTLYMSLSGLREISVIDTPPRNRHPVKTEVVPFDEEVIRRAITEEVSRDGQVFFVHNRVKSIRSVQAFLERLLPGVRFCVAHGQMSENHLEEIMLAFMDHKYDVLISTMIIESGLDIPNVNTIIINRADRFGLAQLYQLRGRVGRRELQAYAYFLIPRQFALTESAAKRLQAMEEFEELGSGYRLAMRDLEIRGAGNVLGLQQHGHVAAIGFELYCKMLKSAVEKLRGEEEAPVLDCKVESPYNYYIPEDFVEDADERMMIYKRMAGIASTEKLEELSEELTDRFGDMPQPARELFDLASVKLMAGLQGVALVRFRLDRSAAERAQNAARLERALSGVGRVDQNAASALATGGADRGTAEFEFAPDRALDSIQCLKLVETFGDRLLFKSGKPFGLRLTSEPADRVLSDARNLLQVAYFSTKI